MLINFTFSISGKLLKAKSEEKHDVEKKLLQLAKLDNSFLVNPDGSRDVDKGKRNAETHIEN